MSLRRSHTWLDSGRSEAHHGFAVQAPQETHEIHDGGRENHQDYDDDRPLVPHRDFAFLFFIAYLTIVVVSTLTNVP